MARREIKPPALLAAGDCHEKLAIEDLKQVALFATLDLQRLRLEELPGTILLRRYRKGEVICYQNDPGYTAFYPLTAKDLLDLRGSQRKTAAESGDEQRVHQLDEEIKTLKARQIPAPGTAAGTDFPQVATVYRKVPDPHRSGVWQAIQRVVGKLFRRGTRAPGIVQDGLVEGQLFGEMSCLYRTPRTATIVAARDCYMLELLRNVLDKMYGNKAFKEQLDALYRARVVGALLRKLPLFAHLSDDQLADARARVELKEFEPGDLICDEHDRSDTLYVIRSGYVKVLKNASLLLGADGIADWFGLCTALDAGGQEQSGPKRAIWDRLTAEPVRAAIAKAAAGNTLDPSEKDDLACALNDLLKQSKLSADAAFKELLATGGWEAEAKKLPASPKKWSQHQQVCAFNRRLLATVFPGRLPSLDPGAGEARLLAYRSEGESIGEIGLVTNRPRTATCIAYDHHGEGKLIHGRVEVIRVDKDLFEELRKASSDLERKIARVVQERTDYTTARVELPLWEQGNIAALSEPFDELGLIQGQKLMLIDLERCTRCDQCVDACVRSHTQGWWEGRILGKAAKPHQDGRSRLFLDGPRFRFFDGSQVKNYLVPATCRQCRDPVCLVGCPVGSIHKGDNGQIVIEDWCIGCSRCANQCPYGAIQMHALGIVAKGAQGWRLRRTPADWIEARTPFRYDQELRSELPGLEEIQLRHEFDLKAGDCKETRSFRLQVQSLAPQWTVAVNGLPVLSRAVGDAAPKPGTDVEGLLGLESASPAQRSAGDLPLKPVLRLGRNVITATMVPTANPGDLLLDFGLYAVARPAVAESLLGEVSEQLVTERAVGCDMCSEQAGQQPACVNACPHDAAMRVETRTFFPMVGTRRA